MRGEDQAFGVYVHWPYCKAKCPYCDFNSHVANGAVDEARFIAAFAAEIAHTGQLTGPRPATSVFFGGGTPSLMAPATVAAILDAIDRVWPLAADCEITLEANPTSVEASRFAGFAVAGVNRVSLGVQALDDTALARLGRQHSAQEAIAAVKIAQAHFSRSSFDLIYARPHQSLAEWESELRQVLDLAAGHISLYQLTIEPGTVYERLYEAGKIAMPSQDLAADLYEATREVCAAAGLFGYEVSNYARASEESRHNLVYWRGQAYAGLGPGAHGRLDTAKGRMATETARDPAGWLALAESQGHGLIRAEPVSATTQAREALLMGLRLAEGVPLARLGLPDRADIGQRLGPLVADGLVLVGDRLVATDQGRLVLDGLIAEIDQVLFGDLA